MVIKFCQLGIKGEGTAYRAPLPLTTNPPFTWPSQSKIIQPAEKTI